MEIAKRMAGRVLTGLGFCVEEVPASDGQRCDLRVTDDECTYLVEAKDKYEDEEQASDRRDRLGRNEIYEQQDLLAHDNRIKGILRKARDQLDRTPKDGTTFQIIWLHTNGIDADTKSRQAFSTFYGDVDAIPMFPHRHRAVTKCFYFDYNASYEMPTIEALILSESDSVQLCLNEFAVRADDFRRSRLCQEFSKMNGVCDPVAHETAGQIICLRAKMPRASDAALCQALKEQTGILYTPLRLTRYSASAAVQGTPQPDSI